jgi:Tfp pilus assembly protein PilF
MNNVLTVLERLTRSHPTYQACFALADLLQSQAEYEAARKWYNRALDDSMLTRHHLLESKLHFQIACSYYQEQNFTLAYDEVQKALACTPPYPSAHNLAALIIIEAGGSLNRAQDHISHALFAAPKYPPYLDTRRQLSAIMLPE